MTTTVFVGDEVTAAGYRLTGVETMVVDRRSIDSTFATARERADLLLIDSISASMLPQALLDEATRAAAPLVLIVPDAPSGTEPPDLDAAVDRVLGIEA